MLKVRRKKTACLMKALTAVIGLFCLIMLKSGNSLAQEQIPDQNGNNGNSIKVYTTVMNPKDVSDIFGRRIGHRFVAIQVTVANHNRDYQFLIHDITIDLGKVFKERPQVDKFAMARRVKKAAEERKLTLSDTEIDSLVETISVSGGGSSEKLSSMDLSLLRGVAEKGYVMDPRNVTIRLLRGAGTIAGGIIGLATFGASFGPSVAAFNGPFITSAEKTFPDSTISQLNRLNDSAYVANSLVPKQQAKVMVVFVPQPFFLDKDQRKKFWKDPSLLNGEVDFKTAFVKVEGSFIEELEGQPPLITGVVIDGSERKKFQNDRPEVKGFIIGRFLSGATINLTGQVPEGVSIATKGTPTSNNLEFLITATHTLRPDLVLDVALANKQGVERASIPIMYTADIPTTTGITPANGVQNTANLTVTIKGSGFIQEITEVTISGIGVKVEQVLVKSSTEVQAIFKIDKDAAVGDRDVRVFTKSAGLSNAVNFKVTASGNQ